MSAFSFNNATKQELFVSVAVGIGSLWLLSKLFRALLHYAFPRLIPGEPNTALLASPRPFTSTSAPVTVQDLKDVKAYDYIIIGGGTAGCVLASRLTEEPGTTVLVIESGFSDLKQLMSRIPAGFGQLFGKGADWNLNTTPQPGCNGRKLYWPRGKMLGGCSAINAMIYNTGDPSDYNEWEKLGNPGWSYDDIMPYKKRSETLSPAAAKAITTTDLLDHGRNGPWKIGYSYFTTASQVFLDAAELIGMPKIRDFNTRRGMLGTSKSQTFIDDQGQRSSTAVAYFTADVASRSNLKIAVGQNVTRIIFDKSGPQPRAVGVEMASGSTTAIKYLARVKNEVILSAGAVHSPQILKLSGIGPAKELESHSIEVVKNLPGVGENLADHLANPLRFTVKPGTLESTQYLANPIKALPALIQWLRTGKGPMTSNVADALSFMHMADQDDVPESIKNNDLSSGPKAPDLEFLTAALAFVDHGRKNPEGKDANLPYVAAGPIMLRPQARGSITLASSSPFDEPIIEANYLNNQHDIDVMVYGLKTSRKMIRSKAYEPYFEAWYPRTSNVDEWTDKDFEKYVRDDCETIYHPMCSNKMGPESDVNAVVDHELKVHGTIGLRVVDASIFPKPIACHPCAPVVIVAEKAADMIKAQPWWTEQAAGPSLTA